LNLNKFSILKILKSLKNNDFLDIVSHTDDELVAVNKETGEVFIFSGDNKKNIISSSVGIVDRFRLQKIARDLMPTRRVSHCLRSPISKVGDIGIYKAVEFDTTFFTGLQTCGSVWHCPVCAAKISERRAGEVNQAIEYTQGIGGVVSFVTRTVPHAYSDSLKDILEKYRLADKKMKQSRVYTSTVKNFNIFGTIKVFEITVGVNGWHLHTHELFFHEENHLDSLEEFYSSLENKLFTAWSKATHAVGFDKISREYGLQVQNGDFAAEYIAKWGKSPNPDKYWGADREISKQHIKKSKSGFSPFDLFRLYAEHPSPELKEIIEEYADTMHGARQLMWSRGLKKRVGIDDLTDKEIADSQEEPAKLVGVMSLEQWRYVCKLEMRVDVLIVAKTQGFNGVNSFLIRIGAPDYDPSETNLSPFLE